MAKTWENGNRPVKTRENRAKEETSIGVMCVLSCLVTDRMPLAALCFFCLESRRVMSTFSNMKVFGMSRGCTGRCAQCEECTTLFCTRCWHHPLFGPSRSGGSSLLGYGGPFAIGPPLLPRGCGCVRLRGPQPIGEGTGRVQVGEEAQEPRAKWKGGKEGATSRGIPSHDLR